MSRRGFLAFLATACLSSLFASPAAARTGDIASFDGTSIHYNFFPAAGLKAGQQAPTVMFGPGWSSGGETSDAGATDPTTGITGVGPLRAAGYNVLTWDPRGFGSSGGRVSVDGPDFEGRDVQALIDFIAKQPEATLERAGDPRLGMTGGSYGGGIQLVAAALDRRIDTIVPDIAWHSLITSLYKDATFKSGWNDILSNPGKARGTYDPPIDSAFQSGTTTGSISPEDQAWFASRGPGDLVSRIHIPTLLEQGTVDTLFTLNEGITNYGTLRSNGVPLKMLWFCGGHGACLTRADDPKRVERATIAWLDRYLKGERGVSTGPGFEWIDQDGNVFGAAGWPPRLQAPLTATGSGTLPLVQTGGSGPSAGGDGAVAALAGPTNGTRAVNAVNVQVTMPR